MGAPSLRLRSGQALAHFARVGDDAGPSGRFGLRRNPSCHTQQRTCKKICKQAPAQRFPVKYVSLELLGFKLMKSRWILAAATCLAFTTLLLSQSTKSSGTSGEKDNRVIEVLTDTRGFDLKTYLGPTMATVKENWFRRIPASAQMKKGHLAIRFRVMRDGHITDMKYDTHSGDEILDEAAHGAILASDPFKPLPEEFACDFVLLKFNFYYNPDPGTVHENNDQVLPCVTSKIQLLRTLDVTVSPISVQVAVGSQQQFRAMVAGTESTAVTWKVGCEGSPCGSISADGLYTAPANTPNPATISVTATLKNTPTESASSTVTIVRADGSR